MKFNINKYLIKDIENKDHPSSFDKTEEYSVLILRLPYIKNEEVDVYSYPFFIKDKRIFIYNRKTKEFELIGGFEEFYQYLDIRIDKILEKLSNLHMRIAKMEDSLYDEELDKEFLNNWLKYKKDLVLIERLTSHAILAFERFLKHYRDYLDRFAFDDLKEHLKRAFDFSKSAVEKLDYLYDFYRTKQDEKMNRIMFILTILSAIFLPLTLITGFFGMNTGGLPFTTDPQGTVKAVILSIIFEIPFILFIFKLMR